MPTPLPPFTPHRIQLVGHVNLGTVRARWDGPILELEDGTRYGPCAVFSAEPVVEVAAEAKASRGALVWVHAHDAWNLCHPNSMHYPDAPYTAYPWGAFSYSHCNAMRDRADRFPEHRNNDFPAAISQITAWARDDGYEVPPWPGVPAAAVEPQPEPAKDRTVYDPTDIRRGDRHTLSDGTRGTVLCVHEGWIAYTDHLPVVQHCNRIVRVEPVDPDGIPF